MKKELYWKKEEWIKIKNRERERTAVGSKYWNNLNGRTRSGKQAAKGLHSRQSGGVISNLTAWLSYRICFRSPLPFSPLLLSWPFISFSISLIFFPPERSDVFKWNGTQRVVEYLCRENARLTSSTVVSISGGKKPPTCEWINNFSSRFLFSFSIKNLESSKDLKKKHTHTQKKERQTCFFVFRIFVSFQKLFNDLTSILQSKLYGLWKRNRRRLIATWLAVRNLDLLPSFTR